MALNQILTVAFEILDAAKRPMHVNEIASEAARTNRNMQLSEDEFSKKVAASLAANVKTQAPSFAKIPNKTGGFKKGVYRVKVQRARTLPKAQTSRVQGTLPLEPSEPVSSNFLGKAGEFAVMAEMLYRGFNASLMAVDEGVDLVASKNNQYFHIQVKTSALGANGKYAFFIKNNAFLANNGGKTFYIFVMRGNNGLTQFAVFPSMQLTIDRDTGVIGGANGISILIAPDEKGRSFTMNKGRSIDQFINKFDLIR